jgi:aminoglycoside/choline kinase family phosphotransferase
MNDEPIRDPEATPDDVAAILTARTKDAAGRELGVFTDQTRPTAEQVQAKIDIARTLVGRGLEIPDTCIESREAAVALLAAMLTEAAFWPEQTQSNQSTYERLRELYQQAHEGLLVCVAAGLDGGAYELDISGDPCGGRWPWDWWQRDIDNPIAARDAGWQVGGP